MIYVNVAIAYKTIVFPILKKLNYQDQILRCNNWYPFAGMEFANCKQRNNMLGLSQWNYIPNFMRYCY